LICQCSSVILTDEERTYIQSKYEDCLCAKCMEELKTECRNQHLQNKMKHILGIFYKPQNKTS